MPLLFPIDIAFVSFAAALGAYILYRTEVMWLRPLVQALQHPHGSWWKRVLLKPVAAVAGATLFVEHYVRFALARFASGSLHLLTRMFNGVAGALHWTYRELGDIAHDVADALAVLRHQTIPRLIHTAVAPVKALARDASATAHRSISLIHELDHRLTRLLHGIDRLLRDTILPRIRRAEHALAGVITRDLPALWRRERALERDLRDQSARLKRIEKALGLGVLAGLVYKVLARVAPWMFCRNVKRLGNVACGLNPNTLGALEALLLGTLAISNLETLARFAVAVEEEVAHEVKDLLSA